MREVYTKNPTLGDPASVDRQLAEIGKKMDILRMELAKYQVRGTKQEAIRKKKLYCRVIHTIFFSSHQIMMLFITGYTIKKT